MLQAGWRWWDCPPDYGAAKTIYNRFHRWANKSLREAIFLELSSIIGTHYENSIDSTIIKAHRSANGKKGVVRKPLAKAGVAGRAKSTRLQTLTDGR